MTTETTPKGRPQTEARALPDPVPEQQPWGTPEDAKGWRRIYRGTGQRREVKNSVVIDLSREQWAWLTRTADTAGLTLHEFLSKLIDDARTADVGP